MSIVVVVGFGLLFLMLLGRKEAFLLKITIGVVELVLIAVTLLAFMRKDDLFIKIPGTVIESASSVEISNTGSFYLDSSQSAYIENKFYLTGDNEPEMSDWLASTEKNVYIYIVNGDKIQYKKNLGVYEEGMESSIMSIYNSWKSNGVVPEDVVRYWFLIFYLEV